MANKELIGQMDFLKQLLSNLLAVLMLDTNGLGQTRFGFYKIELVKKNLFTIMVIIKYYSEHINLDLFRKASHPDSI